MVPTFLDTLDVRETLELKYRPWQGNLLEGKLLTRLTLFLYMLVMLYHVLFFLSTDSQWRRTNIAVALINIMHNDT